MERRYMVECHASLRHVEIDSMSEHFAQRFFGTGIPSECQIHARHFAQMVGTLRISDGACIRSDALKWDPNVRRVRLGN